MSTELIYDKGFVGVANDHEDRIKNKIIEKLNPSDAFVNTTWIENDNELDQLLKQHPKRIICYSGADWENTTCINLRTEAHDRFKGYPVIHVGNTYGDYYYSFWMDFVYKNLDTFVEFPPCMHTPLKLYMCLNRKPHQHRITLFKLLKENNLLDDGYVTLGADKNVGITTPTVLKKDLPSLLEQNSHDDEKFGIVNDIASLGHPDNWQTHFLNIVTETTVHTDVFLSEKIFKPIVGNRPFMILGDYNVYNVLHDWGFDTFDDILGDGYKEKNLNDRMHWIIDTIKRLKNDQTDLECMYKKIEHRLFNNAVRFQEVANIQKLKLNNFKF